MISSPNDPALHQGKPCHAPDHRRHQHPERFSDDSANLHPRAGDADCRAVHGVFHQSEALARVSGRDGVSGRDDFRAHPEGDEIFQADVPQVRRGERGAGKRRRDPRGQGVCPRGIHERTGLSGAANALFKNSISAERIISFSMPIMQLTVFSARILSISWFGAKMIVGQTGLTTGELTSLLSYVMNILMSLMMLSMVFVMVTQSAAAAQRIEEVLEEQPDITSPEGVQDREGRLR